MGLQVNSYQLSAFGREDFNMRSSLAKNIVPFKAELSERANSFARYVFSVTEASSDKRTASPKFSISFSIT